MLHENIIIFFRAPMTSEICALLSIGQNVYHNLTHFQRLLCPEGRNDAFGPNSPNFAALKFNSIYLSTNILIIISGVGWVLNFEFSKMERIFGMGN